MIDDLRTGSDGRSNTGKDEEEGGDELHHEGSNAIRLSCLTAGSQSYFPHSYYFPAFCLSASSSPIFVLLRLWQWQRSP